jgi:hypothetical protein
MTLGTMAVSIMAVRTMTLGIITLSIRRSANNFSIILTIRMLSKMTLVKLIFYRMHCSYYSYYQIIFPTGFTGQGISIRRLQWLDGDKTPLNTPYGFPHNILSGICNRYLMISAPRLLRILFKRLFD